MNWAALILGDFGSAEHVNRAGSEKDLRWDPKAGDWKVGPCNARDVI